MAELYHSVYEGGATGEAWHGPALKPLLKDVTPELASRIVGPSTHSILQLVLHIAYWEEIVLRRLNGEVVNAPINTPEDWPPNRKLAESEWRDILKSLERSHNSLQKAIELCPDDKLNVKVPERDYTNYILLHGIIDHCVYHTAQIALLKKALAQEG